METTTYYPLFHPPLNLALWLTRFFSTFTAIVYFILQADEMLKMTSCWIQPIPRILLFGISFCVRFRLSIFRSIFICVEIDASVFLAVWAAAVAIDSFAAAWAGVGFNAIIWKAFYFFFFFPTTLLHIDYFFLTVPKVFMRESNCSWLSSSARAQWSEVKISSHIVKIVFWLWLKPVSHIWFQLKLYPILILIYQTISD